MATISITGPITSPGKLKLSNWVSYMTGEPKPTDRFWFALDPDQNAVAGGLKLSLVSGPTARDITGDTISVRELSVDPQYQRQGVGEALMKAAESWVIAQSNVPHTMGLGVEAHNVPAVSLYKKLGYLIAARHNHPVTFMGTDGKTCYVMFKRLA